MKRKLILMYCVLQALLFVGCSSSDKEEVLLPPEISGLEENYVIMAGDDLILTPTVKNTKEPIYQWVLNKEQVADGETYTFTESAEGNYDLLFRVSDKGGVAEHAMMVTVLLREPIKIETTTLTILSLERPESLVNAAQVEWKVLTGSSNLYRLSNPTGDNPMFVAVHAGEYHLQVSDGKIIEQVVVTVADLAEAASPYTAKVFDFLPAPGQFVNDLPKYKEGDTYEDMVKKAEKSIAGENASMISLGGWGGYVVFGFDHTIVNVAGRRDFRINGNAFGSAGGRPGAPFGGSCEPGIIMVAYDKNKNGIPDEDEWYEIKGSSNFGGEKEPWFQFAVDNKNDTKVYRDYEMTYYKPTNEKPTVDGDPGNPNAYVSIDKYIRWENNKGGSGYKVKNVFHSQSYYPKWVDQESLTFKGIRLQENGINEGEYMPGINDGNVYFVLYGFRYGYVDNYPNRDDNSAIDIDWAVDKEGNKVDLPGIDFVKVYSGVDQENGWLGECSTEVERGEDLHLLNKKIETINE